MSPRRWLFTVLYLVAWPVLIMALAGDRRWIPGWILSGWIVAVGASTVAWLAWRDPALLAERYRMPGTGGQSPRDRRLVYAMAVGFLLWVVLMPLDGGRFHWTPPLPRAVAVVGGVCLMLGWVFVFRAMADNTFGSALVVGLALTAALAVRSLDEEALLTRELTGYEEYRRRVRYRLIPYVW